MSATVNITAVLEEERAEWKKRGKEKMSRKLDSLTAASTGVGWGWSWGGGHGKGGGGGGGGGGEE